MATTQKQNNRKNFPSAVIEKDRLEKVFGKVTCLYARENGREVGIKFKERG